MAGIATSARQVPMPRPAPAVRFGVPWGALAPGLRYPLGVVALTAAYYASAKIGYALELAGPVAAIIWLPLGVGVSFLAIGGLGFWPGVLLGDLLVNDYGALPLGSALGQTCGNVLEVVIAAALIRRATSSDPPLAGMALVVRVLVAIAAGTVVSATVGALSLLAGGVIDGGAFPRVWRTWVLGDFSGGVVVVPLALAWTRLPDMRLRPRRALEAVALLGAVAGLSELAARTSPPLTYAVLPPLVWAALRFGPRGATVAVAVVVGIIASHSSTVLGPFSFDSITNEVLNAQLFILTIAIATWCLATAVSEREDLVSRLAVSRARMTETADNERRRLEHNLHDGAQQRLTALMVRLAIASEAAEKSPETAAAAIGAARLELSLAIEELREVAHGILPRALGRDGLAQAIQDVAARSPTEVKVVELPAQRLDLAAETTAYYVFAEALTNAQRYAPGASITVSASVSRGRLRIVVADDGGGGATPSSGSGLEGIRDRVEATGGRFELKSPPGRGTRVAAAIPVVVA